MKQFQDNTVIRVEYLVYINKTKKIERKSQYIDYVHKNNWMRRNDDFGTIRYTIQKDYKTTDIVWIEKVEII